MPITVRELLDIPDLQLSLAAGSAGLDRTIRWAHTSELTDPTPWLSGGELLLTTGIGLEGTPDDQQAYVRRLVAAELAGLGFGIGFGFDAVPDAVAKTAEEEGFPVLEVPYPVPFIAISEAVSSRVSEDRLREARLSVEVHERLTGMVVHGSGPKELLEEVVRLAHGWALLFDLRGEVLASAARDGSAPDPAEVWSELPAGLTARGGPATFGLATPRGASVALTVTTGRSDRPEAVFVFGKRGRLEQRDRIVVRHAVTVLGLLLASRRAVVEAERRIAGDILSDAFAGRLQGEELIRRLELVGFDGDDRLTVLLVEGEGGEPTDLEELAWTIDMVVGARSDAARVGLSNGKVAALVSHTEPEVLAESIVAEVGDSFAASNALQAVRVGVGETVPPDGIRDSYIAALFALRAAPQSKSVAVPRDLGSYGFLLGAQPRHVLEGFVRSILGPLIDRDRTRSSELVASVRAFIEAGGRWEQGAEKLGVHRHTLRYRVRQAEELLGRDLTESEDRLEVWLALKASEILSE